MTAMTVAEAAAQLMQTQARFALAHTEIDGVQYRVFANAPDNLREMMKASVAAHGDKDFLIYQDDRLTYPEFCDQVNRTAHMLIAMGVGKGDRVALVMRNYPDLLTLMMAVQSIGAVVVPMNAWWTEQELEYGFRDSGAKLAFADGPRHARIAGFASRLGIRLVGLRDAETEATETFSILLGAVADTAWPEIAIAPEDDFAIMYSSGSTGHPKGVVQTHRGAISAVQSWIFGGEAARLAALEGGPKPGDDVAEGFAKALVVTPLFHVTASHAIWLQCLALGTSVVLIHKWDAHAAIDLINAERITRVFGVPTQCADLREALETSGTQVPSLALLGAGGAKRPSVQVAQQAEAMPAATIASGWGMTETNALGLSISGPDYLERPGAAGRCIPPLQDMAIRDEDGNDLPVGQVGELVVKSPANMRCYLNLPDDTAKVLRDGWLSTGDLARVDEDGFYYIVDRKKSIIIRGGENISTLEVEAAIHRHPDVLEAGVFPVPDARLGEAVGAAVQTREGAGLSEATLREFLADELAAFKIPAHVWLRDRPLPRGGTDKIDRRALQKECVASLERRDVSAAG